VVALVLIIVLPIHITLAVLAVVLAGHTHQQMVVVMASPMVPLVQQDKGMMAEVMFTGAMPVPEAVVLVRLVKQVAVLLEVQVGPVHYIPSQEPLLITQVVAVDMAGPAVAQAALEEAAHALILRQ
jgi:hypothetical protein